MNLKRFSYAIAATMFLSATVLVTAVVMTLSIVFHVPIIEFAEAIRAPMFAFMFIVTMVGVTLFNRETINNFLLLVMRAAPDRYDKQLI